VGAHVERERDDDLRECDEQEALDEHEPHERSVAQGREQLKVLRVPQFRRKRGARLGYARHSFASQLVIAGTPLRQVQEWLGHSTITMTMRYAHLAPGGGREYLAALDANHGNLTAVQGGGTRISA
jgi:integrase